MLFRSVFIKDRSVIIHFLNCLVLVADSEVEEPKLNNQFSKVVAENKE
jgi:hypothetical protein